MSWRSYYSAPTTPTVTKSNPTIKEPAWVSVLPAAKGLWKMIVSFRERGSNDIADNLEAAAEKQAEAHLRTQELMNKKTSRLKPPIIPSNPNPVRSVKPCYPTPVLAVVETGKSPKDTQYSITSESELDSEGAREKQDCREDEKRNRKVRRRNPSGKFHLKPGLRLHIMKVLLSVRIGF